MPTEEQSPTSRRAWFIWLLAVTVYVLAVFHRTSFGVVGLQAAERFGVGPAALGVFTVLQLAVYAAMQVPTGLLVDRFGPRRVLAFATAVMGAGQVLFAVADTYPLGLLARAVLGLGDALTFVSMLRVVAAHFTKRRYAVLTTISAALGMGGNLAATVPLTLVVGSFGWTPTFLVAGLVTLGYTALVLWQVRDTPRGVPEPVRQPLELRRIPGWVREVWRVPGTRLAFWLHFSTMFAPTMLGWMWGMPYLVQSEGLGKEAASSLLSALVIGAMAGGPPVAAVIGRNPARRMQLVIGYLVLALLTWLVLIGWPEPAVPVGVLLVAFVVLSLGLPVSSIAFSLVRDYNPLSRVGTATGVTNVGGFSAVTFTTLGVGLILEFTTSLGSSLSFRLAFLVVVAALVLGSWRTLVWWRRARAAVLAAMERGEEVPVPVTRRRWDSAVPAGT